MAYQAKSYGRVYHNLYHLVPLYKRAKKDVGKNQGFSQGFLTDAPYIRYFPLCSITVSIDFSLA